MRGKKNVSTGVSTQQNLDFFLISRSSVVQFKPFSDTMVLYTVDSKHPNTCILHIVSKGIHVSVGKVPTLLNLKISTHLWQVCRTVEKVKVLD